MIKFTLKEPIFRNKIMIIICSDSDKIVNCVCKGRPTEDRPSIYEMLKKSCGMYIHFPGGNNFIVMPSFDYKNPEFIDILVHELSHLVGYMLREVGINSTEETTEVYAYYHGFWVREILKKIKDSKRKPKKKAKNEENAACSN